MKTKLFIISFIILMSIGCNLNDSSDIKKVMTNDREIIKQNIFYVKDSSTNLCYAILKSIPYGGRNVYSITCVPCDSLTHTNLLK